MSMGKYGNRKDNNHHDIIKAFIALGFVVLDVSNLANCADLIVSKNNITIVIEVKSSYKKKLTTGEAKFAQYWGNQGLWKLIVTVEEVLELNQEINKMKAIGL